MLASENNFLDSDRVQGEVGRAQKVTTRPERRRRARNELRSAGIRKSVQIDELKETVVIAVREEAELRKLLARKEAQIAKGTIQLQEAKKKIADHRSEQLFTAAFAHQLIISLQTEAGSIFTGAVVGH